MAQKKTSVSKKKATPRKKPTKVVAAKPTYEQLLAAQHESAAARENIKVATRRLNREKSFHGDHVQRARLVEEAADQLALAREEASEAKLRFNRLSMEAKS